MALFTRPAIVNYGEQQGIHLPNYAVLAILKAIANTLLFSRLRGFPQVL